LFSKKNIVYLQSYKKKPPKMITLDQKSSFRFNTGISIQFCMETERTIFLKSHKKVIDPKFTLSFPGILKFSFIVSFFKFKKLPALFNNLGNNIN